MWTYLKTVSTSYTCHMWRNFRCLHICHVEKFEITPHDRFFLHRHRLWCLWQIWGMCISLLWLCRLEANQEEAERLVLGFPAKPARANFPLHKAARNIFKTYLKSKKSPRFTIASKRRAHLWIPSKRVLRLWSPIISLTKKHEFKTSGAQISQFAGQVLKVKLSAQPIFETYSKYPKPEGWLPGLQIN